MRTIENIDPRLKLLWCLTTLAAAFLVNNIGGELIIIALLVAAQWYFTRSLKSFGILSLVLVTVGIQLLIIQLLFCREGLLLWQWGIIEVYSDALPNALMGYARTSALAYSAVQFIAWTSSQDATLMLKSFGIPYRYTMLVGIAARFFPVMQREYVAISQSQAVRGLDTHGVWRKVKALPPTFFPLLYRGMRRSSDTALSMELRGFGYSAERTFTKKIALKTWEKLAMLILVLMIITLVLYKILF